MIVSYPPQSSGWLDEWGPPQRRLAVGLANLLVHQTDIVNFVYGKTLPTSCMASGGIYRWTAKDDDRDVPDTLSAIYDYPDRFHINYSCYFGNDQYGYGEPFCGTEGTLEVLNRQDLHYYPQLLKGEKVKARKELHINGPKDLGERMA